jgi:uncharacterized protein YbaR (Trm112 family)
MTPETEIIACPACKHILRVPQDWLGTQVQCPECKAMFRAPVRENGKLTEPELISRPAPANAPAKRKFDVMLLLPAFGLMFCGITGMLVNGWLAFSLFTAPDGGKESVKKQVEALRQLGIGKAESPEAQAQKDEEQVEETLLIQKLMLPLAFVVSAVVLAGGLSITFRWNYRLAKIACVLAALNVPHLCCVPGALFGLWGFLMLNSDESREHFGL